MKRSVGTGCLDDHAAVGCAGHLRGGPGVAVDLVRCDLAQVVRAEVDQASTAADALHLHAGRAADGGVPVLGKGADVLLTRLRVGADRVRRDRPLVREAGGCDPSRGPADGQRVVRADQGQPGLAVRRVHLTAGAEHLQERGAVRRVRRLVGRLRPPRVADLDGVAAGPFGAHGVTDQLPGAVVSGGHLRRADLERLGRARVTHFIGYLQEGCYQGQCSRMPAAAPAATRYGSLIFHLRSSPRLTAAIATAAQMWIVWRDSTTTAPAIAPAAAAVAPATNALIWALSRWRMNHRPGSTTPRKIGVKIATVATTEPCQPAAR